MTSPDHPSPQRLPRSPLLLLGLMTASTVFGPVLIWITLQGGANRAWPPDRPVEWLAVLGTSTFVFGLMVGCVALSIINQRLATKLKNSAAPNDQAGNKPEVEL